MTAADPTPAPKSGPTPRPHPQLDALIAVLEHLRAPGGCAWDREQTHGSLVQYLVEETFELVEAIENGSRDELIEELGDVLYQVIFHSDIAAHTAGEEFTIEDVAEHMRLKMVARHPHVFGDATAETAADVVDVWEGVKATEKASRSSVLEGIPDGMPALALADKVLGRAQKAGVVVSTGANSAAAPDSEDELGDVLLALVACAREKGLDSERALRGALRRLRDDVRVAEARTQSD